MENYSVPVMPPYVTEQCHGRGPRLKNGQLTARFYARGQSAPPKPFTSRSCISEVDSLARMRWELKGKTDAQYLVDHRVAHMCAPLPCSELPVVCTTGPGT